MFKIDKNTHLAILFTFAVIFIVFYLYHTIQDLKKIQNELTKINSDILTLKRNSAVLDRLENDRLSRQINKKNENFNDSVIITDKPIEFEKINQVPVIEEDNESIETQELQDILNNSSSSSSSSTISLSEHEENVNMLEEEQEHTTLDKDLNLNNDEEILEEVEKVDLNSLTLEELKELCKKHGLSAKGSKSILKERLNEIQL